MVDHRPIATALRDRRLTNDHALIDALSVAFVSRWPMLAIHPSGFLPLLVGLRDWMGHRHSLAVLSSRDVELEALLAGERQACLKESVPGESAEALVDAYQAMGLCAGVARKHGLVAGVDRHVHGDSRAVVAVASGEATLLDAIETLAAHDGAGAARAALHMASLLGYPECCAQAFVEHGNASDNVSAEKAVFDRAPSASLDPRLNRLGRVRLISHFPCRADCAPSAALAGRVGKALARGDRSIEAYLQAELATPVLFRDYDHRAAVRGRMSASGPIVDSLEVLGEWHDVVDLRGAILRRQDGLFIKGEDGREQPLGPALVAWPGMSQAALFPTPASVPRLAPAVGRVPFDQLFPNVDPPAWGVQVVEPAAGRVGLELSSPSGKIVRAWLEPAGERRAFARVGRVALSHPAEQVVPPALVIEALQALRRRLERHEPALTDEELAAFFR